MKCMWVLDPLIQSLIFSCLARLAVLIIFVQRTSFNENPQVYPTFPLFPSLTIRSRLSFDSSVLIIIFNDAAKERLLYQYFLLQHPFWSRRTTWDYPLLMLPGV